MIWIIGEYAERIDNADELLESFLDGFQDENTQVRVLCLSCEEGKYTVEPSLKTACMHVCVRAGLSRCNM